MTARGGSRGSRRIVSCDCCASRSLALSPRTERGRTSQPRQCPGVATLLWWAWAYAAALVLSWTQPAKAQDTIDRPVTIYVAGTAGGGIDLYARLVGRHIGRHIPGKPTVTVQLMPGAGGIRAANYLAEQAPRDGTAMTTFASGPILEPLIGARNPGYDMSSFTWIGAITKDIGLCISWGATPFKTIEDVKKQQMVVAGTGAGSETDTWPIVLNDVLGTKFKLVTGYVGSQETILAIERGEAHGRCVFSLSALKIAKPDWLRDKKINVLVLTALEKNAEFPGVPAVIDLVTKEEDRQLLELMVGPSAMARPFVAPPGMPADKAALLRRAFDATMQDGEFRAEAARIQADLAPTTGEEVQKLVARIYATPRPVVERIKKLLAP
jgi:tripartite-type tricarboxylate transporter receptor subunit TctC